MNLNPQPHLKPTTDRSITMTIITRASCRCSLCPYENTERRWETCSNCGTSLAHDYVHWNGAYYECEDCATLEESSRVSFVSRMTRQADDYFGTCPTCHRTDGYINIGQGHWFYCCEHRTRWFVGANLFDSWKDETETEQRAVYKALGFDNFTEVAAADDGPAEGTLA